MFRAEIFPHQSPQTFHIFPLLGPASQSQNIQRVMSMEHFGKIPVAQLRRQGVRRILVQKPGSHLRNQGKPVLVREVIEYEVHHFPCSLDRREINTGEDSPLE
ncbi:MAG: hypothetical protein DDT28_01151 [Dehalococcoidia bacterium]|nr:hypothetical protein [Chloroflexota bacterium]